MPSPLSFTTARRLGPTLTALSIALAAAASAHAQPPAPAVVPPAPVGAAVPPPPLTPPPGADRSPTPVGPVEGRVAAYLLSPEADVAGVMLDDGAEVRVPPHLGGQLAALVKPGDRIRFSGESSVAPGDTAAPPRTITALATGRTLTDTPPPAGAPILPPTAARQGQSALQSMKTSGTVRRVLRGPRGEANGVLLDNGTQVAIPPRSPDGANRLLKVGSRLDVEGYGRTTSYGTALQATVLSRPGEPSVSIYAPAPLR